MCVPMDTSLGKSMRVILRDGTVFKFKEYKSGLYYYDTVSTNVQDRDKTNTTITAYPLLSPVTQNKQFNTCADIEVSYRERGYKGLLGWTETSDFKTYFNNKLLLNCNITVHDIKRDDCMYAESTPIKQSKIMRHKPTVHSKTDKYLYLFQYKRDKKKHLYIDFLPKWFDIITH